MEKEKKKENNTLNNAMYKERFQFLLTVNDDIICQRYFRVNGFNRQSFESLDLKYTIDDIVEMIQNDLVSKSRIFMYYTKDEPVKLTGFGEDAEESTYFSYPEGTPDNYADNERLEPYEVTFKFSFLYDDRVICEKIWDGTNYPKYVRNGVDLTNSDAAYRDREPLSLHFSTAIIRRMTIGKSDLVYTIIKKLCDTLSNTHINEYGEYIKSEYYGNGANGEEGKTYYFTTYDKEYVDGWDNATKEKSKEYFSKLYPSQRQIEYIDKYL